MADKKKQQPAPPLRPRPWWRLLLYPDPHPPEIAEANIGKAHGETSGAIRRAMFTLLGLALFCLLVTFGNPDMALITPEARVSIPFAGAPVPFIGFVVAGPFLLIVITLHLHVFLGYLLRLETLPNAPAEGDRLPTLFNLDQRLARLLAWFIFYALTPVVLAVIAWKASARPQLGQPLLWVTAAVTGTLIFLQVRRYRARWRPGVNLVWWVAVVALAGVWFAAGPQEGGEGWRRPLDLFRAGLGKAWLARADLRAANLEYADLERANLEGARVAGASFVNANLQWANLAEADLTGARFQAADVQFADFSQANLEGSDLSNVKGAEARFQGAKMGGAVLITAELKGAHFANARLENADFYYAQLAGANFSQANLNGAKMAGADLTGAVALSRSQICAAEFDPATVFPDGSRGHTREAVCGGKPAPGAFGLQ